MVCPLFLLPYLVNIAVKHKNRWNLNNIQQSSTRYAKRKTRARMQYAHHITKTCLYNFDPLKPHFYIVKLGFTGVYIIFLISAQKHRLWVLVRTASSRRF